MVYKICVWSSPSLFLWSHHIPDVIPLLQALNPLTIFFLLFLDFAIRVSFLGPLHWLFLLASEVCMAGFFVSFKYHLNITSSEISFLTHSIQWSLTAILYKYLESACWYFLCLFFATFTSLDCKVPEDKSLAFYSLLLLQRLEQTCHVTDIQTIVVE